MIKNEYYNYSSRSVVTASLTSSTASRHKAYASASGELGTTPHRNYAPLELTTEPN